MNLPAQGGLDADAQLKLSIHLPLRNREALTNLLEQLYDPAGPEYRHFLTPDEFDARFGPSAEDYQAVLDYINRQGFTVKTQHANRMLLEVTATVGQIDRAFQVQLQSYAHPTEPRSFFAPDVEPTIDTHLPIVSIAGLNNFARPHSKMRRPRPLSAEAKAAIKSGSRANGNFSGLDYRAAYVPGGSLTGAGQLVGLLEFDGCYTNDITQYENLTGLPHVPLQFVLLGGFNGTPTLGSNSGNGEVALDIEVAVSMAPGLSKVVVYETDPFTGLPNDILQAMSTNTLIKQFSCSWSFGSITTADRTAMDNYFLKMAAQGQSFFDASGDTGAATTAFDAPDDDLYVTLVGGTMLATAGPGGAWLSETVWNSQEGPGNYVSTGGISSGANSYNIPSWQQGVSMASNHGSTTKRNSPDVAMVADNIFILADNGQLETTGGTSASAPLWAAFTALVNQQAAISGLSPVGFLNPALYRVGTNINYAACFDDVTLGNNTNNNATQFLAVPGYDLCTGLGSPSGSSLIIALLQPDGFQIKPGRGPVANGPVGGPFSITSQSFTLTNTGKPAFNWSMSMTSSWLSASTTSGTLTAGGTAGAVTLALNAKANALAAGVYTANAWFTNLTSGWVQLRQFTLQVGQDLVQDGGFEAGDFGYWTLSGNAASYADNFADDGTYTGYLPQSGNYFGALGQVSSLAYLTQSLPTRPGQLYWLSCWLDNPSGSPTNQFQIQWNTNSSSANIIFNQANSLFSDWTNLQFLVQASTNSATLKFGFRNDHDYSVLDSISVLPVPFPLLQSAISIPAGTIQLAWNSLAGVRYQVQYKTQLSQSSWTNLGARITANSSAATYSDNLSPDSARFYRVLISP